MQDIPTDTFTRAAVADSRHEFIHSCLCQGIITEEQFETMEKKLGETFAACQIVDDSMLWRELVKDLIGGRNKWNAAVADISAMLNGAEACTPIFCMANGKCEHQEKNLEEVIAWMRAGLRRLELIAV